MSRGGSILVSAEADVGQAVAHAVKLAVDTASQVAELGNNVLRLSGLGFEGRDLREFGGMGRRGVSHDNLQFRFQG